MTVLHIRCGSDIRETLRAAGIEGDFLEFSDPVCQGPVPADVDDAGFRDIRTRFIANAYDHHEDEIRTRAKEETDALERWSGYDRIVLWFEHDAYDQTILIRLLDWFADRPGWQGKLHLINIDRFPGVERFIGLGQLSPAQLRSLHGMEQPVTPAQIADATAAWRAYRAADPTALATFVAEGRTALPYLTAALRRQLQELPWTGDGLSLTERLSLQAMADGAATPGKVFHRIMTETEPLPYLGDIMFLWIFRGLATGMNPAVFLDNGGDPENPFSRPARLTKIGERLLAGQADWVTAHGVDRWIGGTHVQGNGQVWRWDPAEGQPVLK